MNEMMIDGITRYIPADHNIVGTCGNCGGPIISPMIVSFGSQIDEWCMDCFAKPKKTINPVFGPVRDMITPVIPAT